METNVFGVDGGGWMDGGRCNASTLSLFGVQQGVKGDQEDANGIPALSITAPPGCGQKNPSLTQISEEINTKTL